MSAQTEAAVLDFYRTSYGLGQFRFASDRLEQMRQAVRLARDAGIEVRFVIYPVYLIDSINPDGYANYLTRIRALSYELNVPLTDLHDADRDPAHYSDPSHLNAVGARQLAPRLAQVIAS